MSKRFFVGTTVCGLFLVAAAFLTDSVASEPRSPIISSNHNPSLKAPITLVAREASLSEVLRVLADRSGMNFVVGEGVTREKITIILNNTPLDESINLLVRASGLSYEIIGNSILIAEPEKLKEDVGLSAYVVELKYARAEEVAKALEHLTKNITIDRGGNRLICYASPRVIMEIERIVNTIDKPHILVLLETRLIEVSMDKLDQYGFRWDMLNITETPGDLFTSITVPEQPLRNAFSFNGATRAPITMSMAIDLMVRNGDARMLMDSKLTTTNNREASLHIGEVIPYTIQSYNLTSSGGANQQIEKENVGVMLKMTPHINDMNQITLSLEPEVSNIAGWKGASGDIPVIRTRKTNTTVRVENGQTVILAGLLSEERTTTVAKVPILGSIPVLGLLFQNKREELRKTNLIIEVVPRIINDPAEIERYMAMQVADRRGGRRSDRSQGQRGPHARPAQTPAVQPVARPAPAAVTPAPAPAPATPAIVPEQTAVTPPVPAEPAASTPPAPPAPPATTPTSSVPAATPNTAPAAPSAPTPAQPAPSN